MQELILGPTSGCVVPNTYFSPTVLNPFNGNRVWRWLRVMTVLIVCLSSPCQSVKHYIHDSNTIEFLKSTNSNSHCIRISASCCRRDTPASKPQVYMSADLASMTKTVRTIGSFAQGYSGLKGMFLPCKLWNRGVEGICENVNCLAI